VSKARLASSQRIVRANVCQLAALDPAFLVIHEVAEMRATLHGQMLGLIRPMANVFDTILSVLEVAHEVGLANRFLCNFTLTALSGAHDTVATTACWYTLLS
jgi:hypothetical protein